MKYSRPATVPAVGSFSRQAAGVFGSRAWLDKPLPTARTFARCILAAAEPTLGALYWPCLQAKDARETERANGEGNYQ